MKETKLYYYGGDGFMNHTEIGAYKVEHGDITRYFSRLSQAEKYYNSIKEEKACWSLKSHELIECHTTDKPSKSNKFPF